MNSECRVHSLSMSQNQLDIESIGKFIKGLAGNKSLKTLHISGCTLDSAGWLLFMAFLSSPSCSFENIVMGDDNINDECAAALGTSLAVNETLKSLQLHGEKITPTGWRQFFNFLKSTTTSLVNLDLSCPSINDEAAIFMFSALANNTSLERLEIDFSDAITSLGWIECFRQLMGSKSALEGIIIINGTNIDDEGAAFLVHLISKCIRTVLFLEFIGDTSITAEGWRQFAECLYPKSASSLIFLRIGFSDQSEYDDDITDDVAIDLFVALTNNRSLQELDFDQTELSWGSLDVLTNILCNKTSIASIWQSNHTLESLGCLEPGEFSTELETLLELNKGRYKAGVARTKIMLCSVLDEETVCHVFAPMATTVLPTAIEWIGRDRLGFSAMFCLVHNMPSLFEHGTISGSNDSVALESPRKRPYWNISY